MVTRESAVHSRRGVRWITFAVWAAAAASATYWGLKWGGSPALPATTPVAALQPASTAPDTAAVARLLGAQAAAAPAPDAPPSAPASSLQGRFVLTGVVAGQASGRGAALLAVDGKPPRPYAVGARIDTGVVLQSVSARKAVLAADAKGPPLLTLELPPPAPLRP